MYSASLSLPFPRLFLDADLYIGSSTSSVQRQLFAHADTTDALRRMADRHQGKS